MKKRWIVPLLILLLIVPLAAADMVDTLRNVWDKIISVGNLSALGLSDDQVVLGLTRVLIWLLMFAVFFGTIIGLKHRPPFSFFSRGQAVIISFVIATIAAVFLPDAVLGATGVGWATAIALILIGGPIIGFAYLLFKYPEHDSKWSVFTKIIICLLLFWILSAMKFHITRIGI